MTDYFTPFSAETAGQSQSFTVFTATMNAFTPHIKQINTETHDGVQYLYFEVKVEAEVLIEEVLAYRQEDYFEAGKVKQRDFEAHKSYFGDGATIKIEYFFNTFGCKKSECGLEERKRQLQKNASMNEKLKKKMVYCVYAIKTTQNESSWSPISFELSELGKVKAGLNRRNQK